MAMADRQRKTYDYRGAAGRFRQAGMSEAAADSVAQEIDMAMAEHTVSGDEYDRLIDKFDELIALVKGLKEQVEKMDERLRKVENEAIPDLKVAIVEGDIKAIKWIITTVLAIFIAFSGISAGFTYLFYLAATG